MPYRVRLSMRPSRALCGRGSRAMARCRDIATTTSRSLLIRSPLPVAPPLRTPTTTARRRRMPLVVSEVASPDESRADDRMVWLTVPTRAMAKSSSGGAATLQRSKSKFSYKHKIRQVDPKTDDSSGGGGIGKIIHNGGGGGGDDDDDDDYFFEEGDDGEEGDDKFFSKVLPQLYDSVSVGAVLSEWYRTVADMPLILRRAVEMGLLSSAQLVRFLSMDVRPNATRAVQRSLPTSMSRAFVGRLMADPGFVHKLVIENLLTMGFSLAYEMKMRGENLMKEWDLAAIQTLGLMAATTSVVWCIAPSRSYGAANKLPWQQAMSGLPNNVFDASGPLREYTGVSRVLSFLTKSLELALVGGTIGAATSGISHLAIKAHQRADPKYRPSYMPAQMDRAALGLSLFYGLHAHSRYQLLCGVDRYFFDHSNYLWSYLSATLVCRLMGGIFGEMHRPIFAGLPSEPVRVVRPKKLSRSYKPRTSASNVVPAPQVVPKVTKTRGFEITMSSSSA